MRKGFMTVWGSVLLCVVIFLSMPGEALAQIGCFYGDSPSCPCFVDGGAWDPSGTWIQDIALATIGTQESCAAAVGGDGGKPFYQMVLGIDNPDVADFMALWLQEIDNPFVTSDAPTGRQWWCSETVSYWHRKAGIPYSSGFRNSTWAFDWQLRTVRSIVNFYKTEETLGSVGRGRWINHDELDYDNFLLGVTVPVPGAYVPIDEYDQNTNEFMDRGYSHSMMINEMTVHLTSSGNVYKVTATIVEGNSGDQVMDSRVIDDLREATPGGSEWLSGNKKILGFGIDVDASGNRIYDPDRVHWVTDEWGIDVPPYTPVQATISDDFWTPYHPYLVQYALLVGNAGGQTVQSSSSLVQTLGIPDGSQVFWTFPGNLDEQEPNGVEIEIDLLDVYPVPIKGIVLNWFGSFFPWGYSIQWAGADHEYQEVQMPSLEPLLEDPQQPSPGQGPGGGQGPILNRPISISFSEPGEGKMIRYLKFTFPPGTFFQDTILKEISFIYDALAGDAEENPVSALNPTKEVEATDRIEETSVVDVFSGDLMKYTISMVNPFEQAVYFLVQDALDAYVDYVAGSFMVNGVVADVSVTDGVLTYEDPDQLVEQGGMLELSFEVNIRDLMAGEAHNWFINNYASVSAYSSSGTLLETVGTNLVQVRVENPIPEPATLTLVGLGLLGLFAVVRRTRTLKK